MEAVIEPYRINVNKSMNEVLAYSPLDLKKSDGELNSPLGNLMADALMELANPIFQKRTGKSIDIVLLNYGGIRSSISGGNITTRTAYELMPFENEVVIAKLDGAAIREMVRYLIDSGAAHPLAGIELQLDGNNSIKKMLIQGKPLVENEIYYVATHDYLVQGGDNMTFFSKAQEVTNIDYKVRNLLIDYFREQDTIAPVRDNRYLRIQQ